MTEPPRSTSSTTRPPRSASCSPSRRSAAAASSSPAAAASAAPTSTPRRVEPDWRAVSLWWGDERCVPPDDERSNYGLARRTLLDRLERLPEVHRIRGELDPLEAARRYDEELAGVELDLLLLGLGPDGHIASLFPGSPQLAERGAGSRAGRRPRAVRRARHADAAGAALGASGSSSWPRGRQGGGARPRLRRGGRRARHRPACCARGRPRSRSSAIRAAATRRYSVRRVLLHRHSRGNAAPDPDARPARTRLSSR